MYKLFIILVIIKHLDDTICVQNCIVPLTRNLAITIKQIARQLHRALKSGLEVTQGH